MIRRYWKWGVAIGIGSGAVAHFMFIWTFWDAVTWYMYLC